jgi:hypothetical protein
MGRQAGSDDNARKGRWNTPWGDAFVSESKRPLFKECREGLLAVFLACTDAKGKVETV